MLNSYDVIWISEVNSSINGHLAGFKPYRNSCRYDNHGGVCLYVKNWLVDYVDYVQYDKDDTIWLVLKGNKNLLFGRYYIPPSDSLYFKEEQFASLQTKLKEVSGRRFIVMGDFNAKLGSLVELAKKHSELNYENHFVQGHNHNG